MTPVDFAEAVGWELLYRAVSYDPAALCAFVRDLWPEPLEDPDLARWANLFLLARRLERAWDP
jgi:hypothetical protein